MLIKEAKYKTCKCGSRKIMSEATYGCDWCKQLIDFNKDDREYLEIKVFTQDHACKHLHLCSWRCVYDILPTIKSDYFIDVPFLTFDNNGKLSAQEFFKVFYGKGKPFDNLYLTKRLKEYKKQIKQLKNAIRWALGYTNFRARQEGEGQYWWRKELGERAGMQNG